VDRHRWNLHRTKQQQNAQRHTSQALNAYTPRDDGLDLSAGVLVPAAVMLECMQFVRTSCTAIHRCEEKLEDGKLPDELKTCRHDKRLPHCSYSSWQEFSHAGTQGELQQRWEQGQAELGLRD